MTTPEDTLYSIGEVAHRTGLSVSAIRYYADEGLVPPTDSTDSGHRLYDVDAIARLEFVRTLRDLETGLDGALKTLRDEPFGTALLVAMALGFAAYGLYSFSRSRHARV